MFYLIGIIQLVLLITMVYKSFKKRGFSFLGDSLKIMFILWITNIGLYNLKLSGWYKPSWQINLVVMIIITVFFLLSLKIYLKEEDISSFMNVKKESSGYELYSLAATIIFVLAIILFIFNVGKYGLAIIDSENKIDKQGMDHYAGYVIYMLAVVAQIKYILFRERKKILDILMFFASITVLVLTLNRGPIAFIVATIYIYELFKLIKKRKYMSKFKIIGIISILILGGLAFLQFFAYIGNLRMEYVLNEVYKISLNGHYKMNEGFPSAFVWLYMYLTSPLENAAFSLVNQVADPTYFNNLFYPFIKFFANIFGQGDNYKQWLESTAGYSPYLDGNPGLSVSSFIPQAMQDMGYIGVIIYVVLFAVLAYIAIRIIKNKRLSFVGSLIIYSNILNILLWSVFENSLRIPILLLNIILVLVIELFRYSFFGRKLEWKMKKGEFSNGTKSFYNIT